MVLQRSASRQRFRRLICTVALASFGWSTGVAVGAQVAAGNIVGTVQDSTGAVLAQASLQIRNEQTNLLREVKTNDRGDYVAGLLPPGTYEIAAQAPGFRQVVLSGIRVTVDDTVRINIELAVGDFGEAVKVIANAPLLETDTSTLGHVVEEKEIEELPLNERRFLAFTLLTPGVQLPPDGSSQSQEGGSVSVNGAREQSNNFLLNGVDNNDQAINQFVALPPIEAIQEFKVQSSNSSAEFGRTGGAQVNVVLKSGTNSLHGSAFEFYRDRGLDARNYFEPPECTSSVNQGTCGPASPFSRHQFGGGVGGPIRRDSLFFFTAYEGLRMHQGDPRRATVPSQLQRAAALAAVLPASRNQAGLNTLNLYPAANDGANLQRSSTFVSTPVIDHDVDQLVVKVDLQTKTRGALAAHYALFDEHRFNPIAPTGGTFTNLPGYGSVVPNHGQNLGVTWTKPFRSDFLNEFRFGYNRFHGGIFQENQGTNYNAALGYPTVLSNDVDLGYPNVAIAGFDGIGEPTAAPQDRYDTTFHISNNIFWTPRFGGGRHALKFGADVRAVEMDIYLDILARGYWEFDGGFSGDPLIDLLRGTPDFGLRVDGATDAVLTTTAVSAFVQDDLRLTPNLTANLGLRYEYVTPPVERDDRLSVPDLTARALTCSPQPDCQFIRVGTQGIPRSIYQGDVNNLAPRIGLAWRPRGSDVFVVRSAFGVFYDVNHFNVNYLPRLNPPFFAQVFFPNDGTKSIQTIFEQEGGVLPPVPELVTSDFRDGYMQHWNVDVQHAIGRDMAFDVAYVGSRGRDLVLRRDPNQPPPGGGARPFPQFAAIEQIESTGRSSYHGLQSRLQRRLSAGLSFLGVYTWSKSLDHTSGLYSSRRVETGIPQNSHDVDAEWALSAFHTAHRFVVSGLYELPFGAGRPWLDRPGVAQALAGGWQVGFIMSFASGRPCSVNRSVDQSRTRGGLRVADRPDQIADPFTAGAVPGHPNPACHRTISQGGQAADMVRDPASWFNPCAFAAPSTARFGNVGRNTLIGPDFRSVDLSFLKNIRFGRSDHAVQIRIEVFNLLNYTNFDTPNRIFDSQGFGRIESANAFGGKPPRQVQLGIRYVF
jgi:hypothetical protein